MAMQDVELKIKLTDNTLENIKIMAPFLNEAGQNQVYGLMLGLISGMDENNETTEEPS